MFYPTSTPSESLPEKKKKKKNKKREKKKEKRMNRAGYTAKTSRGRVGRSDNERFHTL